MNSKIDKFMRMICYITILLVVIHEIRAPKRESGGYLMNSITELANGNHRLYKVCYDDEDDTVRFVTVDAKNIFGGGYGYAETSTAFIARSGDNAHVVNVNVPKAMMPKFFAFLDRARSEANNPPRSPHRVLERNTINFRIN